VSDEWHPNPGDAVQVERLVQRVAHQAIAAYEQSHPRDDAKELDIPAQWKWVGGLITALVSAGLIGVCFWVVTTLSGLQQNVTRMSALLEAQGSGSFSEIKADQDRQDERIDRLEAYHRQGGAR
tara:strand:- start:847 stop:1218 length:372 start_codon:yes stop_codon:yes gene_type:complete